MEVFITIIKVLMHPLIWVTLAVCFLFVGIIDLVGNYDKIEPARSPDEHKEEETVHEKNSVFTK